MVGGWATIVSQQERRRQMGNNIIRRRTQRLSMGFLVLRLIFFMSLWSSFESEHYRRREDAIAMACCMSGNLAT